MVLVRPGPRRVEEERLARLVARPEELVVEPVVDHAHAVGIEAEALDRPLADGRARHDHPVGGPRRQVVPGAAEGTDTPRDELGVVEVQHVVQRHDARPPGQRHGHRERIVDEVEPPQRPRGGGAAKERARAPAGRRRTDRH